MPDSSTDTPIKARGLEGVVALDSTLSFIDGQQGDLVYCGYDIFDLAEHATFEEVVYLLYNGELPTASELQAFDARLKADRALPAEVLDIIGKKSDTAHPMAVLRTTASALSYSDPETETMEPEANYRKGLRLIARLPTAMAAFARIRQGLEPVAPTGEGSLAREFLYMLNGQEPGEAAERTFDVCLVLHADHGLNASTFAARVIGSTLSDMYSAVTGAIGALKGPLHGGANLEVMRMLKEVDASPLSPADYVKERLKTGDRVMGFGHRVYKTMDPRAAILRDMVEDLSEEQGQRKWYDYSVEIMETVQAEKGLAPNVDFFSASVYYMLGIEPDLYTPIFAMSRTAGWTAHLLEQWDGNRLIRPRAEYVGPKGKTFTPLADR